MGWGQTKPATPSRQQSPNKVVAGIGKGLYYAQGM